MTPSVADSLVSQLPRQLLAGGARNNVTTVLARIPAACANAICFECRLGAGESRVDVIVGVARRTRWALHSAYWRDAQLAQASQAWSQVWRISEQWASDAADYRDVDAIWLEFDIHGPTGGGLQAPAVLFGLRNGGNRSAAARVLAALHAPGASAARADFDRCWRHLPPGSRIRYAGVMTGRRIVTTRLSVQHIDASALVEYLRAIGWTGELAAVESEVARLTGASASPHLGLVHLDIADRLQPTIGIEVALDRRGQAHRGAASARVLDHLVDDNLCSARRRDGLRQWPGFGLVEFAHELWPSLVVRWINNVKVILGVGPTRAAKAYLSAAWRPWSEIHQATSRSDAYVARPQTSAEAT